jgi:S1-C subfamily serine protease
MTCFTGGPLVFRAFSLAAAAALLAGGGPLCPAGAERAAGEGAAARDAADRVRTKVVVLKTVRKSGRGAATGFLARPGLVITAAHAVSPEMRITAWLNGVSYPAAFLLADGDNDLAVLHLQAPALQVKPVELARAATELDEGEELVILAGPSQGPEAKGDPAARLVIPAVYRYRALVPLPNGKRTGMLKLEAAVRHGDSGSPVIRVRDRTVVGVLSSRELPDESGVSRAAYAVPVEALHPWLETAARRRRPEDDFYLRRLLDGPPGS